MIYFSVELFKFQFLYYWFGF